MKPLSSNIALAAGLGLLCFARDGQSGVAADTAESSAYRSPIALATTRDGTRLFVACATAGRVLRFDTASRTISGQVSLGVTKKGYQVQSNKSIKNETGINRRPDVSVKKDGEVVRVGEVPRANQNGTLVPREAAKLEQYKDAGLPCKLSPIPK